MNVALRKESVDRNNFSRLHNYIGVMVALRKESVDRNPTFCIFHQPTGMSLSARRAWIEIQRRRDHHARPIVALRKESVDRNKFDLPLQVRGPESLSARRAWIEIVRRAVPAYPIFRRSPQGERG